VGRPDPDNTKALVAPATGHDGSGSVLRVLLPEGTRNYCKRPIHAAVPAGRSTDRNRPHGDMGVGVVERVADGLLCGAVDRQPYGDDAWRAAEDRHPVRRRALTTGGDGRRAPTSREARSANVPDGLGRCRRASTRVLSEGPVALARGHRYAARRSPLRHETARTCPAPPSTARGPPERPRGHPTHRARSPGSGRPRLSVGASGGARRASLPGPSRSSRTRRVNGLDRRLQLVGPRAISPDAHPKQLLALVDQRPVPP